MTSSEGSALRRHLVVQLTTSAGPLRCLVHVPPATPEPPPLLLFLHGAGERGSDLSLVTKLGIPAEIEAGRQVPFVAVSPQCPGDRVWSHLTGALSELLDQLVSSHGIDKSRIYLTGVSMGGYGVWKLAAAEPKRFAAVVPVCGIGEGTWASALQSMPTWAFHGAEDSVIPPENSARMVAALQRIGAPAKLTILPGEGHDCWHTVYALPELYSWLLAQRRQN